MEKNYQKLMKGAILLSVSSFLVKILSAVYRVPLQNLVGNEGFYVYQQVYPIYGIAMTLSLSGLPVFISKVIAEQSDSEDQRKIIRKILPLLSWLALVLFLVFFLGHHLIATLMGDDKLSSLIRMVSYVFLLMPFLAVFRGVYQGNLLMAPTAYSQLVEQVLRVGVILAAAVIAMKSGWSIYLVGKITMSGAVVGGLGALLILVLYKSQFQKVVGTITVQESFTLDLRKSRGYTRRFFVEGGLICGYSSLLVLFQLVDSFVIKNHLVLSGLSDLEAKITKGIYDRGQPIVQLGLVVAVALTTSFLPSLTKYHAEGNKVLYQRSLRTFIRVALTVSGAATAGLVVLLPFLNRSLFGDNEEAVGLSLFMGTVLLMSMIQVFQAIFQSQNRFKPLIWAVCIGVIGKIAFSPLLTQHFRTIGASLSTLLGLSCCLLFLWAQFQKKLRRQAISIEFVWKLVLSLGIMVVSLLGYQKGIAILLGYEMSRVLAFFYGVGGVLIGGGLFLWSAIKLKLFTIREWLSIPFGKEIMRFIK